MILATMADGALDGKMVAVSADQTRHFRADGGPASLREALDDWVSAERELKNWSAALRDGAGESLSGVRLMAPLPRAWQWLDGSDFPSHGELMSKVLGIVPERIGKPLMYQGVSNPFLSSTDDVRFPSELGIDFEAELAVIVDSVPMGTPAAEALKRVRLIVQINDWSLRDLAGPEMKTGFGWIQAKPACSMAPFAITPDELGQAWGDGRLSAVVEVERNGECFGAVRTEQMEFGFGGLIAHAAATRDLCAGTIIGSGTVSSADYPQQGSCCIAERRAIEKLERGEPSTPFLHFGETVSMRLRVGDALPCGSISQRVSALASTDLPR